MEMTRYTQEAVANALQEFGLSISSPPPVELVKSKMAQGINTISFVFKKYSLYDIPFLPSHEYVVIDGKTFHPGSTSSEIFNENDTSVGVITLIEEKCKWCSREYLLNIFKRDSNFNILVNNCQIVMGNFFTTSLLWMGILSLWTFCIFPSFLLLAFGLYLIIFAIAYDKLNDNKKVVEYRLCPHIIKI